MQKSLGDALTDAVRLEASSLDIDLRGAVSTAIQNNRDITIADLQRKEAEADKRSGSSQELLLVGITAGRETSSKPVSFLQLEMEQPLPQPGASITLPIWTGGKLG